MNVCLVGVFRRVPWLLGAFQRTAEEHWQRMQRADVVAADAPFPGLTERDFPWFWSREKWEMTVTERRRIHSDIGLRILRAKVNTYI
jgi:hypothetical protein